jgi:hypothetical protein
MDALIGYTGFVGSHLIRDNMDFYNSKNIQEMKGKTYSRIYCCGLPAEKWKANQNPEADRKNMESLIEVLKNVRCYCFVLISTVDVYDSSIPQSEYVDCCPNAYATHPYGKHRREMEEWVLKTFENSYIFRLPALFGHGLKKNALYDMINKNQVEKLRSHWQFQWYSIDWLWKDIQTHIRKNHKIVNLVSPTISLKLIQTLFFPRLRLSDTQDTCIHYNVSSIYGYSHSIEDVLLSMSSYVQHTDKLLVSELAWSPEQSSIFRSFLRAKGILSEEIVPSKRNWDMKYYTNVYSAQSILFGETIQIFQEPERFLMILEDRLEKLQSVGTKIIVFGCPTQRIYSGEDAVSLFRKVGDLCERYGIVFCLENNAKSYGANWLTTLKDTIAFVDTVNHAYIGVNLDTGSMLLENETEIPSIHHIRHVQISFPELKEWDSSHEPLLQKILDQLASYSGKISLESKVPSFKSIESFVELLSPFQRSL